MKPDITQMHKVWEEIVIANRKPTAQPSVNFDDIISSIITTGPFYYYIIDFYDKSISHISPGFYSAHGIEPEKVKTINDILALIHPDDMEYVSKAEKKALTFMYDVLKPEKFTRYKSSYNFRFKKADGGYGLFNHQALILTIDENENFIKSLNIHTDISHITTKNNYQAALLGLMGEPSHLNIDVLDDRTKLTSENLFSKRETEIVCLMAAGWQTKEIAQKLRISVDTVKTHRKKILLKSKCKNMAELAARSAIEGWI
jgi:DNA-binding CsgD family transcriptional regulator